jgi:squalene-hopene/tetraprenyl-beta-curcumene cyclase
MLTRSMIWLLPTCLMITASASLALDDDIRATGEAAYQRGVEYLTRTQQPDGAWSPEPGPAITGLILTALLDDPSRTTAEHLASPVVAKALRYILNSVQPDGSIRSGPDGIMPNYNTAICISALTRPKGDPGIDRIIANAQRYLVGLQWQEGMTDDEGRPVTREHPFYGGAGYGNSGRPDMSNLQFMLQALHDSGLDPSDPAWERALVFITRCQGVDLNNYFAPGTIINDGGVIYATSINGEYKHIPVSYAQPDKVDEARQGKEVSGLRGYGSMTYAAFQSYIYADLKPDDPRVLSALDWMQQNYTLDQNPGMAEKIKLHGWYYFFLTHARAMDAFGQPTLQTATMGEVDWAKNLIEKLASLQRPDGAWVNEADRWMEDDANLVTAYSILALRHALSQ